MNWKNEPRYWCRLWRLYSGWFDGLAVGGTLLTCTKQGATSDEIFISLKTLLVASEDLDLGHQIDKTDTKSLSCTGEVSHQTTLNLLEQQYASRT